MVSGAGAAGDTNGVPSTVGAAADGGSAAGGGVSGASSGAVSVPLEKAIPPPAW
jgi:hypothetical protein